MEFSVLMSVYVKDNPAFLKRSIESLLNQTLLPNQIVIVHDGDLTGELNDLIIQYSIKFPYLITYVGYPVNRGLGEALRFGLDFCKHELVARMDSDDICHQDRFFVQISYLKNNPDICLLGTQISEFIGDEENIIAYRNVPIEDGEIKKFIKHRCPFNHMTVIFKKSEVIRVGSYEDFPWNEDYYLWIKLFIGGCKFANLRDVLVNVRVGKEMYSRRGGKKYFQSEFNLQKILLNKGLIRKHIFVKNIIFRYLIQVVMPNNLRSIIYKKFLRRKSM